MCSVVSVGDSLFLTFYHQESQERKILAFDPFFVNFVSLFLFNIELNYDYSKLFVFSLQYSKYFFVENVENAKNVISFKKTFVHKVWRKNSTVSEISKIHHSRSRKCFRYPVNYSYQTYKEDENEKRAYFEHFVKKIYSH